MKSMRLDLGGKKFHEIELDLMTCAQQAVSYLESIIRLNNLLLSHTFSCPISVLSTASSFFCQRRTS